MRRLLNSWQNTFSELGFRKYSHRSSSRGRRNKGCYRRSLHAELLEDRWLLTTWFVDNLGDVVDGNVSAGQLTLREAINGAMPTDTIKFSVTGTIQLIDQPGAGDNHLLINKSITILGPGANHLTIRADAGTAEIGDGSRVFNVDDGTVTNQTVTIVGLTLAGGDVGNGMTSLNPGGAIRTLESLTLSNSVVTGNVVMVGGAPGNIGHGGGIYASLQNNAELSIGGSQITGNRSFYDDGGGVYAKLRSGSKLTISSSVIDGNQSHVGGGVFVSAGTATSVTVHGSTISNNTADLGDGGGLFVNAVDGVNDVQVEVLDSRIAGNKAKGSQTANNMDGGGIYVDLNGFNDHADAANSTFLMERSVVENNTAQNRGGGMVIAVGSGGKIMIRESRVTNNTAGKDQFLGGGPIFQTANSGGGIYGYMFSGVLASQLTISGSTIDNNSAGKHGGGLFIRTKKDDSSPRSEFSMYNATISTNMAGSSVVEGNGGGIHLSFFQAPTFPNELEGISARFHNVTVTKNKATLGGGIYSLVNSPIHGNTNDTQINNTIVSENSNYLDADTNPSNNPDNVYGSFNVDASHNNLLGDNVINQDLGNRIFGTTGVASAQFSDAVAWWNIYNSTNIPGLGNLADNGGRAPTHNPLLTSPAIDAGGSLFAKIPFTSTMLTSDQRGFPRVYDVPTVTLSGRGPVDIGAVEYSGTQDVILVTTLVDELNLSNGPQNVSLRDALAMAAQDGSTGDNDIIRFAPTLFASGSGTITIASSLQQMTIDSNVTVEGPSAEVLTISGNSQKKLFSVNSGVKATLSGMTLANAIGANGGAIFSQGDLTLDGVAMLNNYSVTTGGAIQAAGTLTIFNSSIFGNNASYSGGGIFFQGTSLLVINSTISSNSTSSGAGIYTTGSTQIVNSTIANNSAAAQGGGISINNGASVLLSNTIVATNKGNGGVENNFFGNANTNSSYNLIGNGGTGGIANERTSGKFNIVLGTGETAGLAQLANVGGTVPTHAIVTGSLAIDAGNDSLAKGPYGQPLATDERGFQRIVDVDATDPVERAVDVGAFEFRAPIVVNSLADDGNNRKLGPGELTLRDALYLTDELSGDDTIRFSSSLFGTSGTDPNTITILYNGSGTSELMVNNNVTIEGPGAKILTVSGNNQSRVFKVAGGVTASINNMTITRGVNGSGGAIYSQGNLTLNRDTISTSYAVVSGGGVYATGNLTLRDSTVAGNTSGYEGGAGITFAGSSLSIINSTLSGNVTNYGNGGGVRTSGNTVVINSTIAGNFANSNGGGIAVVTGGSLLLHNSIVADNSKGIGVEDNISGLANSLSSHNLIGNGGTGGIINQRTSGNFNIVLTGAEVSGLNRLADYGGPTSTKALLAGSLAIDAGNNAVALAYGLVFDQRGPGFSRNADGNDDATLRVDIGAFELGADEYFGSL